MNEGWIKIYQKFIYWEWYKDANTCRLFLHCLLKANWKDARFRGYEIPRGSFVSSIRNLSKELKISEQKIKTALNHLKLTHEITIKTTKQFSIITINNYDLYQTNNTPINSQLTHDQHTANNNRRYIDNKNIYKKEKLLQKEKIEIPNWMEEEPVVYEYDWLDEEEINE